jgi:hypothetical protein
MTNLTASQLRRILCHCALLIVLIVPLSGLADTWQLQVGAQTGDKANQALAFLPVGESGMGNYQQGYIEALNAFHVRYYAIETVDGKPKRVQRSRKIIGARKNSEN